ncbi:MAG: glycoside hydrolase family 9 protein [Cytophagaceae bacterium]
MRNILLLLVLIFSMYETSAGPGTTTERIHIDQFGYLPNAPKYAVISDPQQGFNAAVSFTPGTTYEVRRWSDDQVMFSGNITIWNGGATDASSGDKAWWFNFSSFTTSGEYYIYDPTNNVGSYKFRIADDVYKDVLKAAVRMFYYNRCNAAKLAVHAGANYADGASFVGSRQDTEARSVFDRNNASTAKDLSGGWWDAGDYNKYTTFAHKPIHQLLDAYSENPVIWGDDFNIPESGNGLPDIIDEIKWELDWLKKMQQNDGSALIKVGIARNETVAATRPPSTDQRPRYYYPQASSAATIAIASMFAKASLVLSQIPSLQSYAEDLKQRAIKAHDWYTANPKNDNVDTGEIEAGDADWSIADQEKVEVVASVYLFALTGDTKYRTIIDNNYTKIDMINQYWWGPYNEDSGNALLYYTTLSNSTATVKNTIISRKTHSSSTYNFYKMNAVDPYRAFMTTDSYHWGSNAIRGEYGNINMQMIQYNLDAANHASYRERGLGLINYFHGTNPLSLVYLSNMSQFGAEKSCNEIYHYWFHDGTDWDNASTSSKGGPAPGYVPGGPNKFYSAAEGQIIAPPMNQPEQKAYKDWNKVWPDKSWEITEPGIYYQSAYVKLLSKFVNIAAAATCASPNLGEDKSICGQASLNLNTGLSSTNRTFTWKRNGVTLTNNTASITITQAGTYSVTVDSLGCIRNDEVVISGTLSPDLGPDKNFCNSTIITLDSKVSGSGYSFTWRRNGQVTAGSGSTLNVTQIGTYSVTVSATNCPNATDEIIIGSDLPVVKNDTLCQPGNANLEVFSAGDFDWYDQEQNGNKITSGKTYSPSVGQTTTFYVEKKTGISSYVGRTAISTVWADWNNYENKLRFDVLSTLTLDSVFVYGNANGVGKIRILNSTMTTVIVERTFNIVNGRIRVFVGTTLNPGTYVMDAVGSDAGKLNMDGTDNSVSYPYEIPGVISINATEPAWAKDQKWYPFFYQWKVSTTSGGSTCTRVPVRAVVDNTRPGCVITSAYNKELKNFKVYPNPFSNSITIENRISNSTEVTLTDMSGKVIISKISHSAIATIDADIPAGTYILIITTEDKREVHLMNKY